MVMDRFYTHMCNCEKKLYELDSKLYESYNKGVSSMEYILDNSRAVNPEFMNDYMEHGREVVAFCDVLVGDNISKLNSDELYVLLMACHLHDCGLGINEEDYENFCMNLELPDDSRKYREENKLDIINEYHNEFSGQLIKRYALFLEIPSREYVFAIAQASTGHKDRDLFDEDQYPEMMELRNGKTICLPYITALIRMADDLNIASDRCHNMEDEIIESEAGIDGSEVSRQGIIRHIEVNDSEFVMEVDGTNDDAFRAAVEMSKNLKLTLDECRNIIEKRSPYEISQESVIIKIV